MHVCACVFILLWSVAASEVATNFLPIFYSTEYFFEELFSICIQLLNKTWREMGAGVVDFEKVCVCVCIYVSGVTFSQCIGANHYCSM